MNTGQTPDKNLEMATFAAGCFWCTEAIFRRLKGVEEVVSGYTGGNPPAGREEPSYEQVSTGETGHAEAVQIKFDPKAISYEKLLEVFFKLHDPTTPNRQGADVGSQYRSAVFYHSEEQKRAAKKMLEKMNKEPYEGKIVTQLNQFESFYPAEGYHQEYYEKNPDAAYCKVVIDPKITKLYKEFGSSAKENYKS